MQPPDGEAKVIIMFKAVGDAPLLKQSKFKTLGSEPLRKIVDFLRKQIQRDAVFVYLKSSFAPGMEDSIQSLFDAYGEDGKLVLHYATVPAYG